MKKNTTKKKRTYKKKNIDENLRGSEDIFWTKVIEGFKKLLSPAFK
jgi:hypothetical protein